MNDNENISKQPFVFKQSFIEHTSSEETKSRVLVTNELIEQLLREQTIEHYIDQTAQKINDQNSQLLDDEFKKYNQWLNDTYLNML